jgi:hypothetical protein
MCDREAAKNSKSQGEGMTRVEDIEALVRDLNIPTTVDMDRRVLAVGLAAYEKSIKTTECLHSDYEKQNSKVDSGGSDHSHRFVGNHRLAKW